MLNEKYELKMHSNRLNEKNLSSYSHVVLENFNSYEDHLVHFLELCDQSEVIKNETKYHFKRIYETFTLRNPKASSKIMQFAAANCLRHTIKFDETLANPAELDIGRWKTLVDPSFTYEDFHQIEALLFQEDQYQPNFTTPYDYYGIFYEVFPMTPKHKEGTIRMMNLCFTIPELMFFNAEQIFFGCLLAARTNKDIPVQWILNQTFFPQQAKNVAYIVQGVYNKYKNMPEPGSNAQFE